MEFSSRKSFSAFPEDIQSPAATPSFTPPRRSLGNQQPSPHLPISPPESPSLYCCLASLQCQDGGVRAIAVSGRGRIVLTATDSDRVTAWTQPGLSVRGLLRTGHRGVRALLAHSDLLFTVHADRRVRIWVATATSFSPTAILRWRKAATFPPRRRRVSFFRWQDRTKLEHRDEVSCLALFIAGGLLYTGSWDMTVKVWHVADGTCVDSFVAHEGRVNAVVVGQDDGGVFTAGTDGCVKVWRRIYGENTHALSMVLKFQSSPVNALVIPAGEAYLYSGSSDGYINIWEREAVTGRFHHGGFLQGHRYAVLCLAAVERVLLSGSDDMTIRVWRREEGCGFHVCLAVMEGHRGPVRCIAVEVEMENQLDGGMRLLVYSSSLDRVLKAWRLRIDGDQPHETGYARKSGGGSPAADYVRGEVVELASETWGREESGMNPVLSPRWVEKRMGQMHLY